MAPETAHAPLPDVQKQSQELNQAFEAFKAQNPEVAEAMKVMSISFADYLEALDTLQGQTTTGNAQHS